MHPAPATHEIPAAKRWVDRPFDPATVERLTIECGIPKLTATLLAERSVLDPEAAHRFLHPAFSQLYDPYRMAGMRLAVERLRRAIAHGEGILIYGDYDVDGSTSVVLLQTAIGLAGGKADFHVPHRVNDGYGMRSSVIERAARDGIGLIISVDTGIRDAEVVERAGELGIDVIVTDHHLPDEKLPKALAVLNPNQPGCGYPDKNLCGVGVAFKLTQALLGELGWEDARLERILTSLLKIAAIGTIADMVPLLGENRVIARIGLDGLSSPLNPGLKELLTVSGFRNGKQPGAGDVAFRLAPRLNAAGRMDTASEVVELFTTADASRAAEIALKLNDLNTKRQQTEIGIVEQILRSLGDPPPPSEVPVIVADGDDWHIGVIGIVASRVIERFHRPTLVLSRDPATGLATGSARGIPGFHVLEALESAGELFERFGGHKQAAGCTLRIERIPELRERLNEFGRRVLKPEHFVPALSIDAELPFDRIHDETMELLAALAPHGLGNPAPVFSATRAELTAPPQIIKERHLKLVLEQRAQRLTAMGWRMGNRIEGLAPGTMLDAAFTVERDDYRGGWQLFLKDFRRAADSLEQAE